MAIQGDGIKFLPLYWTYHDQWKYHIDPPPGQGGSVQHFNHYGHMHFFMLGYDWNNSNQNAFSGSQKFEFELKELWGPQSKDFNQSQSYRVVGRPKWYFYVKEVWRRVYIQKWGVASSRDRTGLMYDASTLPIPFETPKHMGPFREGKKNLVGNAMCAPYWASYCRTLPIEYFKAPPAGYPYPPRDNFVGDQAATVLTPYAIQAGEAAKAASLANGDTAEQAQDAYSEAYRAVYDPSTYRTDQPGSFEVQAFPGAGTPPYSDRFYIWPLIEYQEVVQWDWKRLPGAEEANDHNDEDFGDGYSMTVNIPFEPTLGKTNSPFSPSDGVCDPIGVYHGLDSHGHSLVSVDKYPRFPRIAYDDPEHPPVGRAPRYYNPPLDPPPSASETLLSASGLPGIVPGTAFHNPYGASADGRWVQQCMGGVVLARCYVTIEHKLDRRREEIMVSESQYVPTVPFAGSDQLGTT